MSKGIQLWPGERMRAFFRGVIRRETDLDAQAAEKLTEALTRATNRMLVWEDLGNPGSEASTAAKNASKTLEPTPAGKAAASAKSGKPDDKWAGKASAKSAAAPPLTGTGGASLGPPAGAKDIAPFDPYAFSVLVVLTKQGRDGLMKRVSDIKSAENLRRLAEAQHLGIDRSLTKLDDLRKAIVAAAEQRLADRRAAAS